MRIAVAIATAGRADTLPAMLDAWAAQTRLPDAVVISAVSGAAVAPGARELPIRIVRGEKGLCRQRNLALTAVEGEADVVVFADDDFMPSRRFIAQLERFMSAHPAVAVATGRVLADGARGPGLSVADALALVQAYDAAPYPGTATCERTLGAYGCNMVLRLSRVGKVRFDDRLPLYGWQEDIDFSRRAAATGAVVRTDAFAGVHLGAKSGRTSGVKLGYSQVVNPLYLVGKGTMPARYAGRLIAGNVAANLLRSFRPETFVDRRGRLRGNWLAVLDLLRARLDPARMMEVS